MQMEAGHDDPNLVCTVNVTTPPPMSPGKRLPWSGWQRLQELAHMLCRWQLVMTGAVQTFHDHSAV